MPASMGIDRGAILTTLFGNTAVPSVAAAEIAATRKKRGWLPLLTVLFLISYGLMTMLIVEQGATIESQRALIRELFRDSTELSAVRMKAQQEKNVAEAQRNSQNPSAKMQSPVTQNPSTQTPSTQAPSTQAPMTQAPSSQAAQQRPIHKQNQKPQFQMPSRPASDLADDRRAVITI
jgi:type I site-specific restriction endonuclease